MTTKKAQIHDCVNRLISLEKMGRLIDRGWYYEPNQVYTDI